MNRCALVIPTLNAGPTWNNWLEAYNMQTLKPQLTLVIDSASTDQTPEMAAQAGFRVHRIEREEFDHAATRRLGADLVPEAEILIYMTQDAILANPKALERLVTAFADPKVGVAYGQQLPHAGAGPIGAHARRFNYPPISETRSKGDISSKGFKAAFCSDSFAAYRRSALAEVGGFPQSIIFGEDLFVAAKMLLADWKVAYVAEAQVYHSHDYTLAQEFRRYFDIGVFHAQVPWLLEQFGSAEGEGIKFLRSEIGYLSQNAPQKIPSALLRTLLKYMAYRLGRLENRLPSALKLRFSMNRGYFLKQG
ncbi:MAG: rhamnosyltransferase [Meiothermus sp.]